MTVVFWLAIYFVVWWIGLFAVLPFGVHTQAEAGEIVPGTPHSAPAKFRIGRVVIINTIFATVVFAFIWYAIQVDLFGIAAIPDQTRLLSQ